MNMKAAALVTASLILAGAFVANTLKSKAAEPVPPANANEYKPSDSKEDGEGCKKNLEKIAAAILAYRKDHQEVPNWLSDLTPKYLPDPNVFICPVTKKTERLSAFGALDPKIRCSYLYEFPPTPITATIKKAFPGPMLTTREWKKQQMGLVGSEVPIVRCLLHKPVLNLSFGGKIYESPLFWENNFLDVAKMKDFAPH